MSQGWISLHRKIQDSEIWNKEPFTRGQAWVDLILLANHKDGIVIKHDKIISVKRGQVGHSILDLSIRWKWSRTKVNSFLKLLSEMNQISVEIRQRITTIISITNYDKYQGEKQREDNEKTTRRQREDINNNVNNVNNDNKKEYTSNFHRFWNAYPKKVEKQYAFKCWKKAKTPPIEEILTAIENQKQSEQWKNGFIPNPSTWINRGRWEDEITQQQDDWAAFKARREAEKKNGV